MKHATRTGRSLGLAAFTLVEAMLASLIVAVLLVAVLQTVGATGLARYKAGERATARFLADALVADITSLAYRDPGSSPVFGLEAGETAASKVNYNDVDDYNGWSESPPLDRCGNVLPGLDGWRRSVAVAWVNANDVTQTSATETGAKRITVTVAHNGVAVATRVAIRTNAP